MKKILCTIFILGGFLLTNSSCTKQETLVSEETTGTLKSAHLNAKTILIEPEGAAYDTQNLTEAFAQAKDKGTGSVIQLAEGEFYLNKMDIYDFSGTFKGSGKDKTIIHTIPGGIDIGITSPFIETYPFFIEFHGGDITVSDMSFEISDDNPAQAYEWWDETDVTFLCAIVRVSGSSPENYAADSRFQNLSFVGKAVNLADYTPFNVDNCIELGGGYANYPLEGNHVIQNCDFSNSETGIMSIGLSNGNLTIGGSPTQGNFLTNTNTGIGFMAGDHMNVKISNNKMEAMQAFGGIMIGQDNIPPAFNVSVLPSKCNFQILNNIIDLAGLYPDGIYMYDVTGMDDPAKRSKAQIQGNLFKLLGRQADDASQSAINGYSLFDADVSQNIISGNSLFAFYIWGVSSGCDFKFNDFSNYESEWVDIWLRANTSGNKVICETNETTVYDESGLNMIKGPAERGKVVDINNYKLIKIKQHGRK